MPDYGVALTLSCCALWELPEGVPSAGILAPVCCADHCGAHGGVQRGSHFLFVRLTCLL